MPFEKIGFEIMTRSRPATCFQETVKYKHGFRQRNAPQRELGHIPITYLVLLIHKKQLQAK